MALIVNSRGKSPQIHSSVFLAENCSVIGDVKIAENSSVWYSTVIRGDVMPIEIGHDTNIQDGSVIHGTYGKWGTIIGNQVTIGHQVILHGTRIDDFCLIGMGSILMDGSHIPKNCIVGAGSLVTEGSSFESGYLIMGRPAKAVRLLKPEEVAFLAQSAANYKLYTTWY